MAQQRKSPADYGQLSLFAEDIPDWLQPAELMVEDSAETSSHPPATIDDDNDDLGQFNQWLRQKKTNNTSRE